MVLNPGLLRDRGWEEWRKSLCNLFAKPLIFLAEIASSIECASLHWGVSGTSTLAIGRKDRRGFCRLQGKIEPLSSGLMNGTSARQVPTVPNTTLQAPLEKTISFEIFEERTGYGEHDHGNRIRASSQTLTCFVSFDPLCGTQSML